jgi:hypothetical protein
MESTAYPSNWFTHRNLVTDRRHYYLPPYTSVPQYFWRHVSVTLSQLQPSKPASFAPCKWSPRILWWVRPRVVLHHCSEFMRTDPVVEWIGLTTAQKLLWSNWHQPSCSYRIDGTRIWRPIATRPFTSCSVLPHVRSGQVRSVQLLPLVTFGGGDPRMKLPVLWMGRQKFYLFEWIMWSVQVTSHDNLFIDSVLCVRVARWMNERANAVHYCSAGTLLEWICRRVTEISQ